MYPNSKKLKTEGKSTYQNVEESLNFGGYSNSNELSTQEEEKKNLNVEGKKEKKEEEKVNLTLKSGNIIYHIEEIVSFEVAKEIEKETGIILKKKRK